jgi:hypothetical protein
LTALENPVNVRASSGVSGADIPVDLTFGETASLSQPIGVKVMKSRTVKVTMHLVTSLVDDKQPRPPSIRPDKTVIENYLNDVYRPQVNASFVLSTREASLRWDIATSDDFKVSDPDDTDMVKPWNRSLDFKGGEVGPEEKIIDGALRDKDADINVYVLGGADMPGLYERDGKLHQATALGAYGFARREQNMVFIDGNADFWDDVLNRDTVEENKRTIAHEIGHCIVGYGHPDEGSGPAPLPGLTKKEHGPRLMVSGSNVRRPNIGRLLVKGEWDEAEIWFGTRLNGDN